MQNNNTAKRILVLVNTLLFIVLIIGLLFIPTSTNSFIKEDLGIRTFLITISSLLICFINGKINNKRLLYVVIIQLIFYLFTIINLLREPNMFTWNIGSYLLISLLSLIFVFDLKITLFNVKLLNFIFSCLNFIVIIWALGIIFKFNIIHEFTMANFSQYSGWTLNMMLEQNKPVYSFGTHSFSALFTFLMLLVNLVNIEKKVGADYIIRFFIVTLYLFILIMTKSTTALLFTVISIIIITSVLKKSNHRYSFFYVITIILVSIPLIISIIFSNAVIDLTKYNGFQERYMGDLFDSTLSFMKSYIAIGMLRPLNNIMLIDSGLINFMLKGNILLIYFYYKLFYSYAKTNLYSWGILVFISFSIFEIGVSFFSMDARAIAMLLFLMIMIKTRIQYNF